MEAPVAAALGKLDGFNLFDPFWMDPEYEIWYRLLNCGIPLPASTGSDWFVCSNNRVYVQTDGSFTYDRWIDGMKAGRTFITNGPSLLLRVNGAEPGVTLDVSPGREVEIEVALDSHYPVDRVEVVLNGEVVRAWEQPAGVTRQTIRYSVLVPAAGWVAARCYSHARDSFLQEVYAHTSPVYLRSDRVNPALPQDARWFVEQIDEALDVWVGHRFRYASDAQRDAVRDLFRRGRDVYVRLLEGGSP
jgi:hypothetical protein